MLSASDPRVFWVLPCSLLILGSVAPNQLAILTATTPVRTGSGSALGEIRGRADMPNLKWVDPTAREILLSATGFSASGGLGHIPIVPFTKVWWR